MPSAKKLREMYVIFDGRRIAYRGQARQKASKRATLARPAGLFLWLLRGVTKRQPAGLAGRFAEWVTTSVEADGWQAHLETNGSAPR